MRIKTELHNVGLIKELTHEFISGNVYVVKGKNEIGKSTFSRALIGLLKGDIDKTMLTKKAEQGEVTGLITGADNQTYRVSFTLKKDKTPSVTIITPEMKKTSRKSDLADIFNFHHMTVEEFLGLGLTEPGRRKQAELFLNIMPDKARREYEDLKQQYEKFYKERHEKGVQVKIMEKDMLVVPTEKYKKYSEKLEEWEQWLKDHESEHEKKQRIYNTLQSLYSRQINYIKVEFDNEEIEFVKEEYDKESNDIKNAREAISVARQSREIVNRYNESSEKIKGVKQSYNKLSEKLDNIKKRKQELLNENLDFPGLTIVDDQLMYKDDKGEYPLTEKSLSYSRGARILTHLLEKINPNYPIITLSKGREMDNNTIKELMKFAEDTDSIILLEWVDTNQENITFEILEY